MHDSGKVTSTNPLNTGLAQRQRFHWLVAPRSTIIQTSPVHSGVHHDLDAALDGLFDRFVRAPKSG